MIEIETSGFGLSVGTGIAMESLFNPTLPRIDETLVVNKIVLPESAKIYISLNTLVRNWVSSINDNNRKVSLFKSSNLSVIKHGIERELEVLSGLSSSNEIIVYSTIYSNKDVKMKPAIKDKPTQLSIIEEISKKLASKLKHIYFKPLFELYGESIILTHSSMDLVNNEKDRKTRLLESYTGVTLVPREYGKKLRKSVLDTSRLPLNRSTLLIFGDNAGLLNIPSPKYKKIAYDALVSKNITPIDKNRKVEKILLDTICGQFL